MRATGGGARVTQGAEGPGAVGQSLDSAVWSPGEEQGLGQTLQITSGLRQGRPLVVWYPVLGESGQEAGCPEWWPVEQVVRTRSLNGCTCVYVHPCMLGHFSRV